MHVCVCVYIYMSIIIRKNFPSVIFIKILKWQGLGFMFQVCYDIPPNKLPAGFACGNNSGANTSVEHLKFLDGVCAILKLHTHPSIDNGKGVLLTLGYPES